MKQIYKILSMTALVLAGVMVLGCEDKLNVPQQEEQEEETPAVTRTFTARFEESGTKALDATTGRKTFAVGDKVAVFYKQGDEFEGYQMVKVESAALKAEDISSDGRQATFSVPFSDPKPGSVIQFIYPSSVAKQELEQNPTDIINDDYTINWDVLTKQNGTAEGLNAIDICKAMRYLEETDDELIFKNRLAILKVNIKDAQGASINGNTKRLEVQLNSNYYVVDRTPSDDYIYVAVRPEPDDSIVVSYNTNPPLKLPSEFFFIATTDADDEYGKYLTGKAVERSTINPINVTTTKITNLEPDMFSTDVPGLNTGPVENDYSTTANYIIDEREHYYVASDGEWLKGSPLRTAYTIIIPDGATVYLAGIGFSVESQYEYEPESFICWGDYHFHNAINCIGSAHLVLAPLYLDNNYRTNNLQAVRGAVSMIGDRISGNLQQHTLTISGCGRLLASSGRDYAGIGGGNTIIQKNIVINGGILHPTGGEGGGAGIGGDRGASFGNITINGGDIQYVHKDFAGNSLYGKSSSIGFGADGSCVDITFNGGKVIVSSGPQDYYIGSNGNVRFGSDCHIKFHHFNENNTDKVFGNVYFAGNEVGGFSTSYGKIVTNSSLNYDDWCYPDNF